MQEIAKCQSDKSIYSGLRFIQAMCSPKVVFPIIKARWKWLASFIVFSYAISRYQDIFDSYASGYKATMWWGLYPVTLDAYFAAWLVVGFIAGYLFVYYTDEWIRSAKKR